MPPSDVAAIFWLKNRATIVDAEPAQLEDKTEEE
jgi:hypothetical protein